MTNSFVAKEFLSYCEAGLLLSGQDPYKDLEWIGNPKQWDKLENLLNK